MLTLVGGVGTAALIVAAQSGLVHGLGIAGYAALEALVVALTAGLICGAIAQSRQRRADGWQDYFGPSPFLVVGAWLAFLVAASIAEDAVVGWLGIKVADSVETLLGVATNLVIYVILVQVTVVGEGALRWSDIARPAGMAPDPSDMTFSWSTYQWTTTPPMQGVRAGVGDLMTGLGVGIPVMVGTLLYTVLLATILGLRDVEVPPGPVPTRLPGWDLWIILLAAAVVAPIGEEIFFRGFATNAWARSLSRHRAIWTAAILFASVHVVNVFGESVDLGVFIRLMVLAILARIPVAWALGWVYTRRRSIYSSMALHATYNGCLVLLVWWVSQMRPVSS